jgi:hypothetical protein
MSLFLRLTPHALSGKAKEEFFISPGGTEVVPCYRAFEIRDNLAMRKQQP